MKLNIWVSKENESETIKYNDKVIRKNMKQFCYFCQCL